MPPGDRVGRLHAPTTSGATTSGWSDRRSRDPLTSPMSIYEVHLGSWRQGLTYRELADAARRLRHRPRLHPRRAPAGRRAPVRRLLGLPGHVLLRADLPLRHPDDFRYLVDRLHQAGIGVIVDWVPGALPQGRVGAGPLRRHAALRARRPAARRAARLGHATSSTSAAPRCATSWSPTRSTGSRSSTSTGCGSTRSPRCSTSTTPARRASGSPNVYGGRENLEAVAFLQEMNATVYKRVPGRRDDRRGVDGLAGRHPADAPRRARLRLQVEHGLDARLARLHLPRAGPPAVPPPPDDVLDDVRVHRELRAADLPRRGRARQGLAAAQDARRPVAAAGQPAGATSPSCGRTPASSCSSWARSSARSRSGPRRARSTGGCPTTPTTAACRRSCATSTPSTSDTSALWTQDTDAARLPLDRRQRRRQQRLLVPALGRRTARRWPASRTSRRSRTRATASACPTPAAGTRCSTPTPRPTAAPASGNLGAVEATGEVARHARLGDPSRPAARHGLAAPPGRLTGPTACTRCRSGSSTSTRRRQRGFFSCTAHRRALLLYGMLSCRRTFTTRAVGVRIDLTHVWSGAARTGTLPVHPAMSP